MQNDDWALENLKVIRILMESSAIYRRALAPVMSLVGLTGIIAGIAGAVLGLEAPHSFAIYWIAVAFVCLGEAFLLIRRQAINRREHFWSPPTRRVGQAVAPGLLAGLVVGVLFLMLHVTEGQSVLQRQTVLLLVPIWMVLYGLAMHAAGSFLPRRFRIFGLGFILCGLIFLAYLIYLSNSTAVLPENAPLANMAMGIFFGGGHALCGFYLYFTEKRGNVA